MSVTAESFLEAVRRRGSDARDVRDAAHEACHAIRWNVKKPWTRDNIHAKCPRRVSDKLGEEITARAVEQLVCERLSAPCDTLEKRAFTCAMEQMKMERINVPGLDWLIEAIRMRTKSQGAAKTADQVIAFAEDHT